MVRSHIDFNVIFGLDLKPLTLKDETDEAAHKVCIPSGRTVT